jgi:hypothetical protein
MAHFAHLNSDNIVINVIKLGDDQCLDENGNESEVVGRAVCESHYPGTYVQTSYNGNIRGEYAGIGMYYHEEHDIFCGPCPKGREGYIYNTTTRSWEPPIPEPEHREGIEVRWNPETTQWDELTIEKGEKEENETWIWDPGYQCWDLEIPEPPEEETEAPTE